MENESRKSLWDKTSSFFGKKLRKSRSEPRIFSSNNSSRTDLTLNESGQSEYFNRNIITDFSSRTAQINSSPTHELNISENACALAQNSEKLNQLYAEAIQKTKEKNISIQLEIENSAEFFKKCANTQKHSSHVSNSKQNKNKTLIFDDEDIEITTSRRTSDSNFSDISSVLCVLPSLKTLNSQIS